MVDWSSWAFAAFLLLSGGLKIWLELREEDPPEVQKYKRALKQLKRLGRFQRRVDRV